MLQTVGETTSSRLLTLLSLLQGRRDWPGSELADRLGVSGRTVRRDVERLRELGYPVESITGPAGGYRLRAGTAMPPLLLDDDEAIAIAVGLRTAAGVTGIEETAVRALVKLEQVLPSHLRRRVSALQSATMTLAYAGGPQVDPQLLTVIAAACRDHECVRFAYRARDDAQTRRDVEPHSLVNAGRRWYLVAWDRGREAWRTFRLDRVERPAAAGVRFTPRRIPAEDAAAYVAQSLQTAPARYEARVTVEVPAAQLERRRWVGGKVRPLGPGRCELRTSDDNLDWLAVRIAMLGAEFEVHEPPELIERLREVGERIARGAGGPRRSAGGPG
jgi:predicted DNA-binding transcriptional regulator YafY